MPTIMVHAPELSGISGLLLWLYADADCALLNAGGDALTESGTGKGLFTAEVAEAVAALHRADVTNAAGTLVYRSGWLIAGGSVVRDDFPGECRGSLSHSQVLDLIAAGVLGVSSTPSETTELFKFVDGVTAFTTTFDESGNRASVEFPA